MREWLVLRRGMVLKAQADWTHTASMMAQQYNMHLPKGKKPIKPDDLNPYVKKYEENEGINSKEDIMKLVNQLQ